MTTLDILKAARELLSDEECWTQGTYARNAKGHEISIESTSAVKWCAIGACYIQKGTCDCRAEAREALAQTLKLRRLPCSVADYNDTFGRAHADVLTLFDDTITRFEKGETL